MFGMGKKSSRTRPKKTVRTKRKLSPAQLAQRKYASAMRSVRSRAARSRGGRGRIGSRVRAKSLRKELGIGQKR